MIDFSLASTPFGWLIIGYLTLSGVACGASLAAVFFMRSDDETSRHIVRTALWLAVAAIGIGALFLIADLESPGRFYLNFLEFNTSSVIAWGTRIVTIFLVLCLVSALLLSRNVQSNSVNPLLSGSLLVFSLAVGIYPAFVLGQAVARPLWEPVWIAPLFFIVGVHSGVACLYLITREKWNEARLAMMRRFDLPFIVLQVALFAGLIASAAVSSSGIERLFYGELAVWFWGGVVAIGWALPLLVGLRKSASQQAIVLNQLAFLMGALALRVVIVLGGQGAESFIGA